MVSYLGFNKLKGMKMSDKKPSTIGHNLIVGILLIAMAAIFGLALAEKYSPDTYKTITSLVKEEPRQRVPRLPESLALKSFATADELVGKTLCSISASGDIEVYVDDPSHCIDGKIAASSPPCDPAACDGCTDNCDAVCTGCVNVTMAKITR